MQSQRPVQLREKITICFCGTCATANMHEKGEVVATMANLIEKKQGNVKIFDGPGTEEGDITKTRLAAVGALTALAITANVVAPPAAMLLATAVAVQEKVKWVPGAVFGKYGEKNWNNNVNSAMDYIRQKHQENPNIEIEVVGWSRGAVTTYMLANKLEKEYPDIPVNILAIDPVPGPQNFGPEQVSLNKNVKNLAVFLAGDDRTPGFTSLIPKCHVGTNLQVVEVPGNHSTVVGLQPSQNQFTPLTPDTDTIIPQVGNAMRSTIAQALDLLGMPIDTSTVMNTTPLVEASPSERKQAQLNSINPIVTQTLELVSQQSKWVSDYNLDINGKEERASNLPYKLLNGEEAPQQLASLRQLADETRKILKTLFELVPEKAQVLLNAQQELLSHYTFVTIGGDYARAKKVLESLNDSLNRVTNKIKLEGNAVISESIDKIIEYIAIEKKIAHLYTYIDRNERQLQRSSSNKERKESAISMHRNLISKLESQLSNLRDSLTPFAAEKALAKSLEKVTSNNNSITPKTDTMIKQFTQEDSSLFAEVSKKYANQSPMQAQKEKLEASPTVLRQRSS